MSFILSGSVGIRGVNHSWDVMFVQLALNKVPVEEGGPAKALTMDGLCGPNTKRAIQLFQLHHFGWTGADGLVEVEKRTHQKLKEFWEPPQKKKTVPPPLPPVPKEPKTKKFVIMTTHKRASFGAKESDFFFEIRSVPHNFGARYWLGPHLALMPGVIPQKFNGHFSIFHTTKPMLTREFICQAVYMSRESEDGLESKFTLFIEPKAVVIPMRTHLIGPDGLVSPALPGSGGGMTTFQAGRLFLLS